MKIKSRQRFIFVDYFLFMMAMLTTGIWCFYQGKIWGGFLSISFAVVLLVEARKVLRDYRAGRLGELALNRPRGLFSLICYILWAVVVLTGAVSAFIRKEYLIFIDAVLAESYILAYLPACVSDYKAYKAENG